MRRFSTGKALPNIYVLPPSGYRRDGYNWKLNISLYGMGTSPKTWNEHFTATLKTFGLEQSRIDPCLFTIEGRLSVIGYVDDILFTGTPETMRKFKMFLKEEHSLELSGEATRFCGIKVLRDGDVVRLEQEDYIERRCLDSYDDSTGSVSSIAKR